MSKAIDKRTIRAQLPSTLAWLDAELEVRHAMTADEDRDGQRDLIHLERIRKALPALLDVAVEPMPVDLEVERFLAEVRAELQQARAKFPGDRIMTIALAEEFG